MLDLQHYIFASDVLLLALIYIRSFFNLKNLLSNILWIISKNHFYKNKSIHATNEKYLICIPMLREQRVVSETLHYFSNLNYPKENYRIIVVTTKREIADKNENSKLLLELAKSISNGDSFKRIESKYPYLFPSNVLETIYNGVSHKNFNVVLNKIKAAYKKLPTTFDLAMKEATAINKHNRIELVSILNYPRLEGIMSHQINYVVRQLAKKKEYSNSIFAVYNADSRPNPNTLKYVSFALQDFENETGRKPNIVQQSSLFTLNYSEFPKNFTGYVLRAASLFQTKWTLICELSRFRSQSENVIKKSDSFISKLFNTKISHCVGHGLFVRFSLLASEYIPTETINEDLPFGFYQCCKGEPILPLPILENSETPETLRGIINQKRVWFTAYLQYLSCRKRVLNLKKYRSRLEVELLTAQAELTGIIWLVQSFVLFVPFAIAIFLQNLTLVGLWMLALFSYWFIPVAVIYYNLNRIENIAGKSVSITSLRDYVLTSLSGTYVLLTHSIGPVLCIKDFALKVLLHKPILKLKTER